MNTASKTDPVIFLFGPTGVGKTRLLGEQFDGWSEVVVADSIQVYRGLDIGSAKPDAHERQHPAHHLIDICDPEDSFDVGDFFDAAESAVAEIHKSGKIPILSGGTAFYFVNFLYGLPLTPIAEPGFRARSLGDWMEWGETEFRRRLAEVDPIAEQRISPHDAYRLQRAWEVWLQTGRPLSSFVRSRELRPGYRVLALGLDRPRDELALRISSRVDGMLAAGLEAEVRGLLERGYGRETPALKGIGYAEFLPWLLDKTGSLDEVRQNIIHHSRQYAKRQRTFFKSIPAVEWFHPDDSESLRRRVQDWLTRDGD